MKLRTNKPAIKVLLISSALLILVSIALAAQSSITGSPGIDIGRKFDAYGFLRFKEEKARLDNLAAQLKSETQAGSKCYIYVFAGRGRHAGEAKDRACRAKSYLITEGGIDAKRVIAAAITNRSEDFKVELWIWPREAPDNLITSVYKGVNISDKEAKSCGSRERRKHQAASNKPINGTRN